MLCLLLMPITTNAGWKTLLYQDETYKVFRQGKLYWLEIRIKDGDRGEAVYYIPRSSDLKTWERISITKKGHFSADIFYLNLPPPFSLLLPSDMICISMIVYYPEKSAFIVYFNKNPIYFMRTLLDKVKNV